MSTSKAIDSPPAREEPSEAPSALYGSSSSKNLSMKLKKVDPVPVNPDGDEESQPLLGVRRPLDPGDPAVLPLNLHNVQLLKYITKILQIINAVLFLLVFLLDFIGIPYFFNPGRSFYEFDIVLITLATNALLLWRFDVPAGYERTVGYVQVGLLLIDLVVILSVPGLRTSMGFFGTFLTLWLGLNILFEAVCLYYVEQGRNYQEMRLTGRVETRRLISELLTMTIKGIFKLVVLVGLVLMSLRLWLAAFDTHEQPWGQMVPVLDNRFRVHVACFGDVSSKSKLKQPIVLLEGGQHTLAELFSEWVEELHNLDKLDRYCVWDRPGYAFSDSAPSPVSVGIITEYLVEALDQIGVTGPFLLVGFDSGGLYLRMFALRNPSQTHSLLLVDAWHEDLLKNNPFGGPNRKNEPRRVFKGILEFMNNLTGFRLWLRGIFSPFGVVPEFHWLFHPRSYSSKNRIYGRDMRWSLKYIRARLQEQLTLGILSYNEVRGADLRDVPLGVISSDYMIKTSLNWGKWQRELSKLSSHCIEWVIAENLNHKIWKAAKGRRQLQDLLLQLVLDKSKY